MDTNLIVEGFKFMALGMGTVFVFLIILIFLMNVMSTIIHRFFPEPESEPIESSKTTQKNNNTKVIAAITAAIAHHRQG